MEFEKLKKIIAEVLNVDPDEITMETTFQDDLGADSLMYTRSSWVSRKSSISRSLQSLQSRLLQ